MNSKSESNCKKKNYPHTLWRAVIFSYILTLHGEKFDYSWHDVAAYKIWIHRNNLDLYLRNFEHHINIYHFISQNYLNLMYPSQRIANGRNEHALPNFVVLISNIKECREFPSNSLPTHKHSSKRKRLNFSYERMVRGETVKGRLQKKNSRIFRRQFSN